MTFKPLVLREVARQQDHGRPADWVAVRGTRSDAVRDLETIAAGRASRAGKTNREKTASIWV
jgi:hypothetical protein